MDRRTTGPLSPQSRRLRPETSKTPRKKISILRSMRPSSPSSPTGWTDERRARFHVADTPIFGRETESEAWNSRDRRLVFIDGSGSHVNIRSLELGYQSLLERHEGAVALKDGCGAGTGICKEAKKVNRQVKEHLRASVRREKSVINQSTVVKTNDEWMGGGAFKARSSTTASPAIWASSKATTARASV